MPTLWLDDVRDPSLHGYIGADWVKTVEHAIEMLATGKYSFASLDHDLTVRATLGIWDGEVTGHDVVLWLEAHPEFWPKNGVRVHSFSEKGRERMLTVIRAHYGTTFQTGQVIHAR